MGPDIRPVIDADRCDGCGRCVEVCPLDILVPAESGVPEPIGEAHCFACGQCVAVCPLEAISHPAMKPEHFRELLPPEESTTPESFLDLLRKRRSVRRYTDEQISGETIMRLIEAAVQAPSGLNEQSWHFNVIQDPERLARVRRRIVAIYRSLIRMLDAPFSRLMLRLMIGAENLETMEEARAVIESIIEAHSSGGDRLLWGAPTLIIVHSPEEDPMGEESAHYAVADMMAMATAMGLGTCVVGFLVTVAERDGRLREYLQVPEDHDIATALVVGYPDAEYLRSVDKRMPPLTVI